MTTFQGPQYQVVNALAGVPGVPAGSKVPVLKPGVQVQVWTLREGGSQVTALTDLDGNALPGYVESDESGNLAFKDPADRYVLWGKLPGVLDRVVFVAVEAKVNVGQAIADSAQAVEVANDADTKADSAVTTATGADGRSVEAVNIATEARQIASAVATLSVDAFGAAGDGETDDTAAVQAAIDALPEGGGTIAFSPGKVYFMSDMARLRSNMVVQGAGATLKKKNPAESYILLAASSNGAAGYGSSVKHVTIRDLTVEGDFATTRGASITMNHAQDVTVERCVFRQCIVSGHALDLGGCDGVTVRECTFLGQKVIAGREYVEAVQLDHCIMQGNAADKDTPGSYDGLPTINVTVEGCRFLPLELGGTTYPAPNPLGIHSRVEDMWIEHVRFRDNLVVDGVDTSTITDAFAQISRGWLHFFAARDVQITGNRFVVTDGRASMAIRTQTLADAIALADVAKPNPDPIDITPMPCTGLRIENNRFEGFNSTKNEPIISLAGRTNVDTGPVSDVQISGNTLHDCAPSSGDGNGQRFVSLNMCRDVQVSRNFADRAVAIADVVNLVNFRFDDNQCETITWFGASTLTCVGTHMTGNQFTSGTMTGAGSGVLYFRLSDGIVVANNRLTTSDAGMTGLVRMSQCTSLLITENQTRGGTNGIYVYSSSERGRILNNMILGYGGSNAVSLGAVTNVTESGTVSS